MIEWWTLRTKREQVMLAIMAAIAIPVLGWLLVAMPLANAKNDARADYLLALDRNARVKAMLYGDEDPVTAAIAVPLVQYLDEQAGQRGFTLAVNAEEGPGRVRIAIPQASGQSLLGWLGELEAQGLTIENVRISPGEAGGVSLTATISGAAR